MPHRRTSQKKRITVSVGTFNKKYSDLIKRIGHKMGMKKDASPKKILRKIYLQTLETPAMSEVLGYRTAEHPAIGIESKQGPLSIRVKGGITWKDGYVFDGSIGKVKEEKYAGRAKDTPMKRIKEILRKKWPITSKYPTGYGVAKKVDTIYNDWLRSDYTGIGKKDKAKFDTGPRGFYVSPHVEYYYRVGNILAEKCPNSIIFTPLAKINILKNVRTRDPKGKLRKLRGVIELKKPVSYRIEEIGYRAHELHAIAKMLNSMISGSKGKEKEKMKKLKRKIFKKMKTGNVDEKLKIYDDVRDKLEKFVTPKIEKNMDEIYEKTGYSWDPKWYPFMNIDMQGRFCDYDSFEKVRSRKKYLEDKKQVLEQVYMFFRGKVRGDYMKKVI